MNENINDTNPSNLDKAREITSNIINDINENETIQNIKNLDTDKLIEKSKETFDNVSSKAQEIANSETVKQIKDSLTIENLQEQLDKNKKRLEELTQTLNSFVNMEKFEELRKNITGGGDIKQEINNIKLFNKYLKYKIKYLKLKEF